MNRSIEVPIPCPLNAILNGGRFKLLKKNSVFTFGTGNAL